MTHFHKTIEVFVPQFDPGLKITDKSYEVNVFAGDGDPNGQVTSFLGGLYLNHDAYSGVGSAWVKTGGAGNTGWRELYAFANAINARLDWRLPLYAISSSGSQLFVDFNNGCYQSFTMNSNKNLAFPINAQAGDMMYLYITQSDPTRLLAFSSEYQTEEGSSIDLTASVGAVDRVEIFIRSISPNIADVRIVKNWM